MKPQKLLRAVPKPQAPFVHAPGRRLAERPRQPSDVHLKKAYDLLLGPGKPIPSPKKVVAAIHDFVDRAQARLVSRRGTLDYVLAVAWDEQLRRALGYERMELRDTEGRLFRAVVSPDRKYAIRSEDLMRRVLGLGGEACSDNTVLLLFDLLRKGGRSLPAAKPGSYTLLG